MRSTSFLLIALMWTSVATAEDWPMWRRDSARSAASNQTLPGELHLQWSRQLLPLKPAYRAKRLQFDAGHEPVVLDGRMLVSSSATDSVTAYDSVTGHELWRFTTNGPIRFAPVAWQDRVFVGSDDGFFYCLSASQGNLLWKFRAVPSNRKVLGNGRLISLWPVRGGPVVHEGVVYFAAGVWSFEGTFVYALDAKTGQTVWLNDSSGYIFGQHPHAAEAFGGVTPQGYLVVTENELVVPCGQALPARYDLKTGKLISFELPKPGRLPGGWFASSAAKRRGLVLDGAINRDQHEDKVYKGPGSPDVRNTISLAGKPLRYADSPVEIDGTIHSMLVAAGKLYIVTTGGEISCFGNNQPDNVQRHELPRRVSLEATEMPQLTSVFKKTNARHGFAVVYGVPDTKLLADLLKRSEFRIIAIEPDDARVLDARRQLTAAGQYGQRVAILAAAPEDVELPKYLATLLVVDSRSTDNARPPLTADLWEELRPYGGVACLPAGVVTPPERFRIEASDGFTLVHRGGRLEGSVNYTGGWSSSDQRVRAPLGVLWFGDELGHFKRSPQPKFVDGVMISHGKDWSDKSKRPYRLLPAVFSDVYTGRVMSPDELLIKQLAIPDFDHAAPQPNQYRPPTQKNPWKPDPPVIGQRVNPLTGQTEPRAFPKSYGCDGGVNYGFLYTMRSGTPAFYDLRLESGTCSISGPRSGCTNSIIPACGLLNVPYYYEGCTCSYPLPVALAMAPMPEVHEQWFYWGPGKPEKIQRVGLNFGAPGDRMTRDGTLWLDHPNRGGPSPKVDVTIEPTTARFYYRHSTSLEGGKGWPWVGASGLIGAEKVTVRGLKPGNYTVKLTHALPDREVPQSAMKISLNGSEATVDLQAKRLVQLSTVEDVKSDGTLTIRLESQKGQTLLNGLEIIAADLPSGNDPVIPELDRQQLFLAEQASE